MKIDINIESQLEEIWHRIGLDDDEVEDQYQEFNRRIQELCKQFLQENIDKINELQKQAEEAEEDIRIHIKRFNLDASEDFDESMPLRERIKEAQEKLMMLQEDTHEQEETFISTYNQMKECFEILEMGEDEQGEFSEPGDDYGYERIDKMNNLLVQLKEEIESRQPKMQELVDDINELHEYLCLPQFEMPETLGNPTFVHLEEMRDSLVEQLNHNREEANEILKNIHNIEKVLKWKLTPNNSFEICSDKIVEKYRERLTQLEKEKEKKIPEFIEATKKRLLALWNEMHIPVPSASDFPFVHNSPANKRTLVALESEVSRIENLKAHIEPMLELIAQREDILNQYKRLQSGAIQDSTRLTSRRGGAASSLLEEERIRKKYQVELPKIHAKLIPQLEEYQATFGEPFLWDGEDLLEEVRIMHRNEEAAMMKSRARAMKKHAPSDGKSTGRSSQMSSASKRRNLAQRPPFQLQEFML